MRRLVTGMALLGVVFAVLAGASSAGAASWTIVPTPAPPGARATGLNAVSCVNPNACVAVGSYQSSTGRTLTLAERWNGTSWSLMTTRNREGAQVNGFLAVSCVTATTCTAVRFTQGSFPGLERTLIEHLRAGRWRIQPSPNASDAIENSLAGVSCTAADVCTAVGGPGDTLALRMQRGPWFIQSTPPMTLGTASFLSVSCTSATFCMAGGAREIAFSESWNGSTWRYHGASNDNIGGIQGIYCASASACLGVGYNIFGPGQFAMSLAWDGTRWRDARAIIQPGGSSDSDLTSVSCTSLASSGPASCYAAGSSFTPFPSQMTFTLVERFDGSGYSVQSTPNPPEASSSTLNGISCVPSASGDVCMAVGDSDATGALAELMR